MQVMVVDDSRSMRRIIKSALKRIGLTDVVEASNGVEAIQHFGDGIPDLILLDWNMPKMNGIEFLKRIKAHDKLKEIPVIMVTSEGRSGEVKEALEAGAANYVVKPFEPQDLAERIETVTEFN